MDYLESRPYQPGDDIRNMDWRVTARTGEPFTKVFQEERERPVICVVDMTPSMYFATRGTLKVIQAVNMAAILGWAAVQRGDRIGSVCFSMQEQHEVRPAGGRRGISRYLKMLHDLTVRSVPGTHDQVTTAVESLQRLRRVVRPGSLIALFSDFAMDHDALRKQLSLLRQHCDIAAFNVIDPIETMHLPANNYPISNGQQAMLMAMMSGSRRDALYDYFQHRHQGAADACKKAGVHYTQCQTDQMPLDALAQLFQKRGAMNNGRR